MEIEVLAIEINNEPIELYKLLKIANLVGGGGEAKIVISEGYVHLNGEVETQKRKKVYAEDIVQFNGEAIMPVLSYDDIDGEALGQDETPVEETPVIQPETHNKAKAKSASSNNKGNKKKPSKNKAGKAKEKSSSDKTKLGNGRRSISF